MTDSQDAKLKQKQVFTQTLEQEPMGSDSDLTSQMQFEEQETFIPTAISSEETQSEAEENLEQVIRPKTGRRWLASGLLTAFSGLVGWQAIDSIITSVQSSDWLALGWAGFMSTLAAFGVGAIGKELWKLKTLRHHFSIQEQSEALIEANSVGQGKAFCESIAKQSGIKKESPSYDRWTHSVNASHSDAEVLDMYDAMVVSEQDKKATKIVTQHATESAALVAISPLAIADMLLVAWRNFKMIDSLADVYGVELGYWSRLKLFKATLINMAAAGASEIAIDASMDLMSMDLAGKVSARAGQGLGVGILTARLGVKAMALLRPIPWHPDRKVKLGAIRKQIVEKIASITIK
ncbi:TIGR01620 family protein [Vibrio coralliilyticus]|uniref:YcjF family protein n=1 Tax=Vibrio coralliilyticus TaxID=190893 RepID=UPI00155FD0A1|nr:TIGR01620 family protein [Vibrio coralliilyticus]NRF25841.1 TIGR01620 family protein [Vibrio coralliilyticus]NRF79970.1 TIGR01620 family protein [Vibrio coralliilyticus]